MLQPLGDRVVIKPDVPPDTTESGLHLVQDWKPENCGAIVAVGTPRHPLRDVAEDLAARLRKYAHQDYYRWDDQQDVTMTDAATLLLDLAQREPQVKVGDVVVFSWQSGQEVIIDGVKHLLMREDDLLGVLEGETA